MSWEKRREIAPYTLHHTNQALKSWNDDVPRGFGFKDYAEGRIEIHIHYGVRRRDSNFCQYCVVFKRADTELGMDEWGKLVTPAFEGQRAVLGNAGDWQQEFMLIGYVAFVDEQQGVIIGPSTLIRLHPLDHCRHVFPKPFIEFRFSPIEGRSVLQNRETDSCALDATRVLQQYERPKEMVECASGVVDTVANKKRPLDHWRGSMDLETKDMHPRFCVQFFGDRISVSIEDKGIDGTLEFAKVFFCPRDFRPVAD